MRNTYSGRGAAARAQLRQSAAEPRPRTFSVCTVCDGEIEYVLGATYGLWGHLGTTTCTADPNTTCDRSQIRKEARSAD